MSKEQFKGLLQSFLIKIDKTNLPLALNDYSAHLSNLFEEKDQRIAELEEQLANSIRPKYKIGQEVYKVYTPNQKYPFKFKIIGFKITKSRGEDNIFYNVEEDGFDMGWYPDEILFATKEEAEAKLEELQGEKNGNK